MMSKVIQKLNCPHCHSAKVVKNGKKSNGQQNYKCQSCNKQFQDEYFYNACNPAIKELMKRMLLRGSGVRDICNVRLVEYKCCLAINFEMGETNTNHPPKKVVSKSSN